MKNLSIVILAAGKSTRFKSQKNKLLHELGGRPIISHVLEVAKKISKKNIIIVCNKENIKKLRLILKDCKFVVQKKQKGTADAISSAKPYIKNKNFIILFGDVPLISKNILSKLIQSYKKNYCASMIAFKAINPFGYGRVNVEKNYVVSVIEEINASNKDKKILLCNSGIMIANKNEFFKNLNLIKINKIKKEKNITELFNIYYNNKKPFSIIYTSEKEMLGVNTLEDLLIVEKVLQEKLVKILLIKGVEIQKSQTSYFSVDCKIEAGVIIEPNVILKNNVTIKKGTSIKSFSYLEGVRINKNCMIGPQARIRPNSTVMENSKIGNFVEIKNSKIGKNTSIAHLSYIGDSVIGDNVNIGAGTITCNYDGAKKHKTIIKNGVFIGSNSSLIAPLTINKNSKIAAGSVINKNVPQNKLAIERSSLKIIKKR